MIRVFIVEDHPVVRASLRALLARETDMTVCGEASSAREAVDHVAVAAPHVVLIDVSLPDISGIELADALHRQAPELVLAMLSGHVERSYVRRALTAGARGYIVKGDAGELLDAIRALNRGEPFISRELGGHGASVAY